MVSHYDNDDDDRKRARAAPFACTSSSPLGASTLRESRLGHTMRAHLFRIKLTQLSPQEQGTPTAVLKINHFGHRAGTRVRGSPSRCLCICRRGRRTRRVVRGGCWVMRRGGRLGIEAMASPRARECELPIGRFELELMLHSTQTPGKQYSLLAADSGWGMGERALRCPVRAHRGGLGRVRR